MEDRPFNVLFSLPPELRLEIYLFATPPRVVQITESIDQEFEDFTEEVFNVPHRLKIDPSLVHFAFNWCHRIPTRRRQPQLESFGFTSSKPAHQPWTPSPSTPEIPLEWLDDRPLIAWELAKYSHLYSKTPIPPLLHMCRDSRMMLMKNGYQIAFRTRSSQPRTWFHFGRDTLFLKMATWNEHEPSWILSGSPWDLGQFDPEEMKLVRNLALDNSAFGAGPNPEPVFFKQFSSVLRLFPRLTELVLVEWSDSHLEDWPLAPQSQASKLKDGAQKNFIEALCVRVPIEEIDSAFSCVSQYPYWRSSLATTGYVGNSYVRYKQKHGATAPFFERLGPGMEKELTKHMNSVVNSQLINPVTSWNIPRITVEHILSPLMYKVISRERVLVAQEVHKLQEQWSSIRKMTTTAQDQSSQQQDAEAAFAKLHWPYPDFHNCNAYDCGSDCADMRVSSNTKKWWIQEWPGK